MSNLVVVFVLRRIVVARMSVQWRVGASRTMRTLSNTPTTDVFTRLFIFRKSHFLELCI